MPALRASPEGRVTRARMPKGPSSRRWRKATRHSTRVPIRPATRLPTGHRRRPSPNAALRLAALLVKRIILFHEHEPSLAGTIRTTRPTPAYPR